jgi:hypothetical protein
MSAAHTPGPWRSTGLEYEPEAGWFVREAGDGRYLAVASVHSTYREIEEIEANARLIAAAPELLEALEAAVADSTGQPNVWFFKAKDAIAKARQS